MDTLKRNDITRFPRLDPELKAEADARYLQARDAVQAACENYWIDQYAVMASLPCQALGLEEVPCD